MKYDIHFAIAGLIVYVMILVNLRIQYNNGQNSVIKLRNLIIGLFMADLLDIVSAITIAFSEYVPVWINYVTNTGFFILEALCMSLLPVYIRYVLDPEHGKKSIIDYINEIIVGIFGVICATSFLTKLVFYFEGREFKSGVLYDLPYVLGIYFILYSFIRLMQSKRRFSRRQFATIVGFICISVSGSILQFFIPGSVFVLYFVFSIAAVVIMFGLETPDNIRLEKTLLELKRSESNLQEALERAQAADVAKSEFLARMSHEIRTPINAVLGMNELIARETTQPVVREYSADIADAGQALLALINDILDMSKIEAGRMELTETNYEPAKMLHEVNNILAGRFEEKGLKFKIKNNPEIPRVLRGDDVRIRQIIINLLSNALKYTETGSVELMADFSKLDESHIELIMSVKDTGIGIRDEDKEALFESFKRIDLEHNRKREGTGLGLNITKSLVEMMHGFINVESVYGEGSTFIVHIVQEIKDSSGMGLYEDMVSKAGSKKYKASFKAPGAHILVVDDVRTNLMVIKGLLKQTEITVDTALSGAECLDIIKTQKFDVIFLDHMMPEMDGIETMKYIRDDKSHCNQDTPVIMLTANAIMGAKELYIDSGFEDYLSKPIDWHELEQILVKHLPEEKVERL